MYLLLYVDDMSLAAINMSEINSLKAQLSSEFEMKDLGAAKKRFLVWRFTGREAQGGCTYHRGSTLGGSWNALVCRIVSQ